jgi:hypothetical protein
LPLNSREKEPQKICVVKPTVETNDEITNQSEISEQFSLEQKPEKDDEFIITEEVEILAFPEKNLQIENTTPKIRVKNLPGDKLSTKGRSRSPNTNLDDPFFHLRQVLTDHQSKNPKKNMTISLKRTDNLLGNVKVIVPPSTSTSRPKSNVDPVKQKLCTEQEAGPVISSVLKVTNQLRPWLKARDLKIPKCIENMLKQKCLVSLYKCMNPSCDFYTEYGNVFVQHLNSHSGEQKYFCCYCSFFGDAEIVQSHILSVHGTGLFSCKNCFYRTTVLNNIKIHYSRFHPEVKVLQAHACQPIIRLNKIDELIAVKKTARSFVQIILCASK